MRLNELATKAGVDVTFSIGKGQQHVFPFMAGRHDRADEEIARIAAWYRTGRGRPIPSDPGRPPHCQRKGTIGMTSYKPVTDYDSIVIGAGFSGLAILYHLREIGQRTLAVDGADGIGGTWLDQPVSRCADRQRVPVLLLLVFQGSSRGVDLDRALPHGCRSPGLPQLRRRPAGPAQDIRLRAYVERAVYDEAANLWTVHLAGGETLTTKYLISGMGVLSQPSGRYPRLGNASRRPVHAARWPREGVDLKGKRVGLIGLGASGIQIVPEIAPEVGEFFVFQRQPNYVVETTNAKVTDEEMRWVRETYDAI